MPQHGVVLMEVQLERIATALEKIVLALEKKKAARKEYNAEGAEQMRQIWNQFTPDALPKVRQELAPSSTRARNASARWREKPDREYWSKICLKIGASSFCLGGGDKKWLADFEFFVRSDTHSKVLEGKYDSKAAESKITKIVGHLPDGTPIYSNK